MALTWNVPGNAYAAVGSPEYPHVLSTYRLTEHHLSGTMSRWLPWLAELQPELFCEISPEHAAEIGVAQHRLGGDLDAARLDPGQGAGDAAHPAVPRCEERDGASRRPAVALGLQGRQHRRRGQRPVGAGRRPERDHPRGKVFVCQVQANRPVE